MRGAFMAINVEARIIALEERVGTLEYKVRELEPKVDQVLEAVVDLHNDMNRFRSEVDRRFNELPDVVARAVAPLLRDRERMLGDIQEPSHIFVADSCSE